MTDEKPPDRSDATDPSADGADAGHRGSDVERVQPDEVRSSPGDHPGEQVTQPAKLMRLGAMARQLLEEVRTAPLDDAARERFGSLYSKSVDELADSLSPELHAELRALSLPFDEEPSPSTGELRVAQAQLVGWLEGLFHGIQATVMAQQFAARQQLEQIRDPAAIAPGTPARAGTYL